MKIVSKMHNIDTRRDEHFFALFLRIPLVHSVFNIGHNLLDNLKAFHPLVDTTLTSAEQVIYYIGSTQTVAKLSRTLERPLELVDSYAYSGLKRVEHNCPAILMKPEEMKAEALSRMTELRGMGAKKLEQIVSVIDSQRKEGMNRALVLLEGTFGNKVHFYVDIIDKTVDDYLPPLDEHSEDEIEMMAVHESKSKSMFTRLAAILPKVQKRIFQRYNHLVVKVGHN